MQSRPHFVLILLAALVPAASAQATPGSQSPSGKPAETSLVNSAGPDVSLQNSEALFYVAAT